MFQSEGWLGPMKVVRQGDSDTFTYVSGHTRTCSLYCYLRMAFDLQLELPKWMRSMAQSVPVMVAKEPVSVADRQNKIVNTKTDVNTKRKKKHLKKQGNIFRTLIHSYWCIIRLLALLNAFILEKTILEEHNFQTLREAHRVFKRT